MQEVTVVTRENVLIVAGRAARKLWGEAPEDITQTLAVELLDRFEGARVSYAIWSLRGWWITRTRAMCRSGIRPALDEALDADAFPSRDDRMDRLQDRLALEDALPVLPNRYRRVLILRLSGTSTGDIARAEGVSPQAVRGWVREAVSILQGVLDPPQAA